MFVNYRLGMAPLMLQLFVHKSLIPNLKSHVSGGSLSSRDAGLTERNDRTSGSHMPRMDWGASTIPAVQLTSPELAAKELLCFCHLIGKLRIVVISIVFIVVACHGFLEVAAFSQRSGIPFQWCNLLRSNAYCLLGSENIVTGWVGMARRGGCYPYLRASRAPIIFG